jgi:polyhydroxyalkanoate synthase subunit PhaC
MNSAPNPSVPSVIDINKAIAAIQEAGTRWIHELSEIPQPNSFNEAWKMCADALANEPEKMALLQARIAAENQRLMTLLSQPGVQPNTDEAKTLLSQKDKRFSSDAWQTNPAFRNLAESYLGMSQLMLDAIDVADFSPHAKHRTHFFMKQYLDAVSPANFLLTNPDAMEAALKSQGETLRAGIENLKSDMAKGHISMTDESAFYVGKNIAMTPGSVVFENEIFQLLQYAPQTSEVYLRPLLMVPPCINKFYILDLRPDNSFIEYAVQQGFTVFVMSWRNVNERFGNLTWDDYLLRGVIKAIDTVRVITNVEKINTLGFCVGGTMLASALAVLRRMGHDVVESTTLLTTFLDFSEVGDIEAYVDEAFVKRRQSEVGKGGIINGAELAFAFSSLRANDLVWNYVSSNYLQGKKPPPFDLLFWNGDSTNLPGPWYCYYLQNTYFENNLIKPDKLTMCGVPVDLRYVDMPAFVFAAREDHIVPWRTAFASTRYLGGEVQFILGAAGHIAGVVNPASKNKRSYWTDGNEKAADAKHWLDHAKENPGSWWPHWAAWLSEKSGRKIGARTSLGNAQFPSIEPAPGRYVREKN